MPYSVAFREDVTEFLGCISRLATRESKTPISVVVMKQMAVLRLILSFAATYSCNECSVLMKEVGHSASRCRPF
jgi:hypothetical protein